MLDDLDDYEAQQDLAQGNLRPDLYLDEVIEAPFIRYDTEQENLNDDPR